MKKSVFLICALFATACAPSADEPEGSDEASDYDVDPADGKADGVPAVFDQNNVVADDIFLDDGQFTAPEIQKFLEESPYHNRSWLADYTTPGGKTAAQAIFDAATAEGINPMMLVARLQGEMSLVSKTARPSASRINAATGCGCPDGGGCSASYRGFEPQLTCSAKTMRKWYDASEDGTAQWRVGKTTTSLDNKHVSPKNSATASLYSYTPWVLPNRGGAWLTWNVTRKYVRFAESAGYIDTTGMGGGSAVTPTPDPQPAPDDGVGWSTGNGHPVN
ncbi:MAG TPA: hypothetical protein VGM90_23515 [Kofleriaceae bacterium]|jgi:hypothetical protein